MRDLPVRRSVRLQWFDYTSVGAYFLTLVAFKRICHFGEMEGDEVRLNPVGELAAGVWRELPTWFPRLKLDSFIVMPNHMHGILVLEGLARAKHPPQADASPLPGSRSKGTDAGSVSAIVQTLKALSTRRVHRLPGRAGLRLWQRGFYDHVVRDEEELNRIRTYIEQNPLRWALDRENPSGESM